MHSKYPGSLTPEFVSDTFAELATITQKRMPVTRDFSVNLAELNWTLPAFDLTNEEALEFLIDEVSQNYNDCLSLFLTSHTHAPTGFIVATPNDGVLPLCWSHFQTIDKDNEPVVLAHIFYATETEWFTYPLKFVIRRTERSFLTILTVQPVTILNQLWELPKNILLISANLWVRCSGMSLGWTCASLHPISS